MREKWAADKIVKKKISDLIPYERNSKIHPDSQIQQLVKSIQEWGWTVPLLIDEKNNVISGHGRLFAAEELKMKTVPCIVAKGWTDQQRRAYVIADNKLAEQSVWNDDLLYVEMNKLLEDGFDIDLLAVDFNMGAMEAYEPNVTPLFNTAQMTEDSIARASGRMDTQMRGISSDKASEAKEVVCPYCAETFKVQ